MSMDRKSFSHIAAEIRPKIISRLLKAGIDAEIAEDIAQETLLKLWSLGDKLCEYSSPLALAYVISHNKMLDELRRSHTDPYDAKSYLIDDPTNEADASVVSTETCSEIERLISSLPDAQRIIITMRHLNNMEIADIAETLSTSEGCVRTALSRARHKLKSLIDNSSEL